MKNSKTEPEEKPAESAPHLSPRADELAIPEVCVYDDEEDELVCVSVEAIEFEDVALPEITHCAWSHKEEVENSDKAEGDGNAE